MTQIQEYNVIILDNLEGVFTYSHNQTLNNLDLVEVPFGKNQKYAIVIGLSENNNSPTDMFGERVLQSKPITNVVYPLLLTPRLYQLCEFLSNYYIQPLGSIMSLCVPLADIKPFRINKTLSPANLFHDATPELKDILELHGGDILKRTLTKVLSPSRVKTLIKNNILKEGEEDPFADFYIKTFQYPSLSPSQIEVARLMSSKFYNATQISFSVQVVDGVTGSGKTEVYSWAAIDILEKVPYSQILITLPEISLSNSLVSRFEKIFNCKVGLWHSKTNQKSLVFQGIKKGKIRVIIGTRSSILLPFKNLQLIVIDEEHDQSYKQTSQVCYNGRDCAIMRAKLENIPIVLSSATPSIETEYKCYQKKYYKHYLTERFYQTSLPTIQIVEIESQEKFLTKPLYEAVKEELSKQNQVLLFINKRGYAPMVLCTACKKRIECKFCDVGLTKHMYLHSCVCHYCGFEVEDIDIKCEECNSSKDISYYGPGIEKVYDEIKALFPAKRVSLLSSDISKNDFAKETIKIEEGLSDIILGTQIISKGFHFKGITLVGIITDPTMMNDFKSNERLYQLVTQVCGRAGREKDGSRMIIQTYNPKNKVIKYIQDGDKKGFYNYELNYRMSSQLPPFMTFIEIKIKGVDKNETLAKSTDIGLLLEKRLQNKGVTILGPAPDVVFLVQMKYRYNILISFKKDTNIHKEIKSVLQSVASKIRNLTLVINVDP